MTDGGKFLQRAVFAVAVVTLFGCLLIAADYARQITQASDAQYRE